MVDDGFSFELGQSLGIQLMAILLNAYFFGIVSQQLYVYCVSRFEDPVYVKAFVFSQFAILVMQTAVLCHLAWKVHVDNYGLSVVPKTVAWHATVSFSGQLVLILMANAFLAARIHSLTRSRLQSGLVLAFSAVAFIVGIFTLATTGTGKFIANDETAMRRATSVVWHALQAMAGCLITFFLLRALLACRSGLEKTDSIVNQLVSRAFRMGLCTMLWAILALGTFFLFPRKAVYTVFDVTSGSIYTHMIYDGLLSCTRLRNHLAEQTELEVWLPSQRHDLGSYQQSLSSISHLPSIDGKRSSTHGVDQYSATQDASTATQTASGPSGNVKDADSELEAELVWRPSCGPDQPLLGVESGAQG